MISAKSRTREENSRARSAYAGSSERRWTYSFIEDPQPAEFTTT